MAQILQDTWPLTSIPLFVMGLTLLTLWSLRRTDNVALTFGLVAILQSVRLAVMAIAANGSKPALYLTDALTVIVLGVLWIAIVNLVERTPAILRIAALAACLCASLALLRLTGHGALMDRLDFAGVLPTLAAPLAFVAIFARRPVVKPSTRALGVLVLLIVLNRAAINYLGDRPIQIFLVYGQLCAQIVMMALIIIIVMSRREEAAKHLGGLLEAERNLFRSVLDNMPVAVFLKDMEGRYVTGNAKLVERYGLTDGEFAGRTARDFGLLAGLSSEQIKQVQADDAHVKQTKQPVVREMTVRPPGKPPRDVILSRFSIVDADGRFTMIGVTVMDVTELKRLERMLQRSQKLEAIGQLAGGIAHDFNNIVGAISGYARFIAEDTPVKSDVHGFAQRLLAASERATQLISQLLTYSRREPSPRETISVTSIITETAELLRPIFPATTRVKIRRRAEDLVVLANGTQLTQMLINLCINANDALRGKPGSLTIEVERRTDVALPNVTEAGELTDQPDGSLRYVLGRMRQAQQAAVIRIADTAGGMSRSVLERAFEPFFTTKPTGKGNGLGLSIVQSVVLACDGALVVTTEPGGGTCFEILLPIASGAASQPEIPKSTTLPSVRRHGRVLIIDDDMDFGDMMQIGLERCGFETAVCHDPAEALAIFEEDPDPWDAVVTDQTMPGLTGYEAIARIKAAKPDTACVLCTGESYQIVDQKTKAASADALLFKPVQPAELAKVLEELICAHDKAV